MNTFQRLDLLLTSLKEKRQKILDGLIKSTPEDYAGVRYILGQAHQIDEIITSINSILKDNY